MFDDLRQQVNKDYGSLPEPDPDLIDGGEKEKSRAFPILALIAIIVCLAIMTFLAFRPSSPKKYSVQCYQDGNAFYASTVFLSGYRYYDQETGSEVVFPSAYCLLREVSK